MEKGFDRIGTDSDPGISRDYKNNPTMLEIIQNKHSSDIREDLQESINYIAGKMPKEMRIPFRAGSLKVFKDGHKFLVGSNKDKRMVLCDDDKIIKDLNPGGAVTAIELGDNDEYAYIACDLLIKQISLKTFETVKTYKGHYDKITALVRSPDDKMLYSCSHDYSVRKNVIGDFSDGESHILHVHD